MTEQKKMAKMKLSMNCLKNMKSPIIMEKKAG